MKQHIKAGFTDYTTLVFIPDPASTDGSGKTGLVAANLTVSGVRVETDNDVTVTDYTASLNDLTALTDAHTDWGLKEVSSTLAPGLYRLDIADAIFAAGAWTAVVYVMVTTSAAAASPMEFILVAFDQHDGVRLGLTALPNAAADAAGGLVISDAGGLDADAMRADVAAALADTNELQTDWVNGGRLDLILDARSSQTSVDDLPTNAELATALGTADDAVLTQVALVKAKTDLIPAAPAAVGDIPSAGTIADAVHDEATDGATTLRESIRLWNSALGGKASGLGTATATFRDLADTKDRIVATVDADGNRTAVTRDLA